MRTTLLIVSLLATGALAQEAKTWRAYDLDASPLHKINPEREGGPSAPPFGLIGLAQPSMVQRPDGLWATGDNAPQGIGELAPDILRALIDDLHIVSANSSLVINGSVAEHATVTRTIELLRARPLVSIELRYFSLPRDGDATVRGLINDALAGNPNLPALRKLDANGGWSGGTMHAVTGSWMPYESTHRIRYVPDFDAEIAQGASISDPVAKVAMDGLRAAVLAYPLNDGRVLIRLMTSAGKIDPRIERFSLKARDLPDTLSIRDTNYGSVELAQYRGCCSATSIIGRSGQTHAILLGSPDDDTDRINLLLLTPRVSRRTTDETTLAFLPTGSLTTPNLDWSIGIGFAGQPKWFPADKRHARFRDATTPLGPIVDAEDGADVVTTDYAGGGLVVRAKKASIQSMRSVLAGLEASLLQPVRVEVDLVVDLAGKRTRIGAVSQPALTGERTSFGAYRTIDYIGDHDVEVAQESRISDPIHRTATAGMLGNARVWRVGKQYRGKFELSISALEPRQEIKHGTAGVSPLQRVPQTLRRSTAFLDFPDGKAREIDLGSNPFGDRQGRLIVVVRVR